MVSEETETEDETEMPSVPKVVPDIGKGKHVSEKNVITFPTTLL
jgi:hypothetical protein